MTFEQAKSLVIFEGNPVEYHAEALYLEVRMGEEPTPERMQTLMRALQIIYEILAGQPVIERPLAAALWGLGESVLSNVASWERSGRKWRSGFPEEASEMFLLIQNIFTDEPLRSSTE